MEREWKGRREEVRVGRKREEREEGRKKGEKEGEKEGRKGGRKKIACHLDSFIHSFA
jgi:flagellar biosynthesis/type III secretory pathway protein FliH